jgi:hypothetical protein
LSQRLDENEDVRKDPNGIQSSGENLIVEVDVTNRILIDKAIKLMIHKNKPSPMVKGIKVGGLIKFAGDPSGLAAAGI